MEGKSFSSKGNDLKAKADKKLKGSFFGNLMKGKSERQDDAKELYVQAANCYKLSQDFESAVLCYELCIKCEENELDAAGYYKEAAICIKNTDTDKYFTYLKKAIEMYSLSGRISTAAGLSKDAAQELEDNYNYEAAIEMFEKSG